MDYFSVAVSVLSATISGLVAWLTLFRRGTLRMTAPTFIAFCYDQGRNGKPLAKIFVRSLLYSTGRRGNVIENMYLRVRLGQRQWMFNIWGYGEDKLFRGSGLFVGESGVAANHHFNPPHNVPPFTIESGEYQIQIFATLPGHKKALLLQTVHVTVDQIIAPPEANPETAIWFEWQPDQRKYLAHLESRPKISF